MTVEIVELELLPLKRLEPVVGDERVAHLGRAAASAQRLLAGRVVWNVNSTAAGGGVAEMLRFVLGYARGGGVDARWAVIGGSPAFFDITKRLHNHLHGTAGDGGELGDAEALEYAEVVAENARRLLVHVRSGDLVVLHDPQTAGLVPRLRAAGAVVVWRCHIGTDLPNTYTRRAWEFLRPYVSLAHALVFSCNRFRPPWPHPPTAIIAPSIDPQSPKNQPLDEATVGSILAHVGILANDGDKASPTFTRADGSPGEVVTTADVLRSGSAPGIEAPLVVQVSRWDRLKDMTGVMAGFAQVAADLADAHLILAGPAVAAVVDDPEGRIVLDECVASWRQLAPSTRAHVHLACLPMDDLEQNAAIVNALQRHATVVVQKSLAEGFGLTVTEAMWKRRPVVASAVGGITEQLTSASGVLLENPTDLGTFSAVLAQLLREPERRERLGSNAHERVRGNFLPDRQLLQYAQLFEILLDVRK